MKKRLLSILSTVLITTMIGTNISSGLISHAESMGYAVNEYDVLAESESVDTADEEVSSGDAITPNVYDEHTTEKVAENGTIEYEQEVITNYASTGWKKWQYSNTVYNSDPGYVLWCISGNYLYIDMTYSDGGMTPYYDYETEIPWYGWDNNIQHVIFYDNLTTFSAGGPVFSGLALKDFIIQKNNVLLGQSALGGCKDLTYVNIDADRVILGNDCMRNCPKLEKVEFSNCTYLQYGACCFKDCISLETIDISPEGTGYIPGSMFENCSALKEISLPKNIEHIYTNAFSNCSSLSDVYYGGTKEAWEKIEIYEGNDSLLNAKIHCSDGTINTVNYPSEIPSIYFTFTKDMDLFYTNKYNVNSFNLKLSVLWMLGLNEEVNTFNNVQFTATLPSGLSFSESATIKNYSENIGTLSQTNTKVDLTLPVYITTSEYVDEFEVILTATAEGYSKASTNTYKIAVEKGVDYSQYTISVHSDRPTCTVGIGETAIILPVMEKDDVVLEGEYGWNYSIDDQSIASIVEYEQNKYGVGAIIEGHKNGSTSMRITHIPTGQVVSVIITVGSQNAIYNINTLKNSGIRYAEMYSDNFVIVNKTDSEYVISFDIYNLMDHVGAVEVYDSNNKLVDATPIKKFKRYQTDLWEVGEDAYNALYVIANWNSVSVKDALYSQKTSVELKVPIGGYFIITNDSSFSTFSAAYNNVDLTISMYDLGKGIFKTASSSSKEQVSDLCMENIGNQIKAAIINGQKDKSYFDKFREKVISSTAKSISKQTISDMVSGTSKNTDEMLTGSNIDLEKEIRNAAKSVGVDVIEDVFAEAGGPAGIALKILFLGNKGFNIIEQTSSEKKTCGAGYIRVNCQDTTRISSGVMVEGVTDDNAKLVVTDETSLEKSRFIIDKAGTEKIKIYDISLYVDSTSIQPSGKIKIKIPIPALFNTYYSKVLRIEADGSYKNMDAVIEGAYLVFYTDHLSTYLVFEDQYGEVEKKLTSPEIEGGGDDTNTPNDDTEQNTPSYNPADQYKQPGDAPQRVTSISLDYQNLTLGKGGKFTLNATVSPADSAPTLKWKSSNKKVATVNSKGVITAKKKGTCKITVKTADGSASATCKLTVKKDPIKVKSAKLNKKKLSLKKGKSYTLKADFKPFNATIKSTSFESSDKKIATVSKKGVVKAKKKGSCTITVTIKDKSGKSKTAKCKVTVK